MTDFGRRADARFPHERPGGREAAVNGSRAEVDGNSEEESDKKERKALQGQNDPDPLENLNKNSSFAHGYVESGGPIDEKKRRLRVGRQPVDQEVKSHRGRDGEKSGDAPRPMRQMGYATQVA